MRGHYLLLALLVLLLLPNYAHAHRSGCHRWHSCPSDRGTYICGDTGHCSACPDNQFCESGKPRRTRTPSPKPSSPRVGIPAGPQVAQVIDGDTIRLTSGERVRLIGVNAPERKEWLGSMATKCLKDILGGQRVRLEVGVEPRDRYKRLLAHVYTKDGLYVNAELLRRGCAILFVIGANAGGHLNELATAQDIAIKAKRGVWRK